MNPLGKSAPRTESVQLKLNRSFESCSVHRPTPSPSQQRPHLFAMAMRESREHTVDRLDRPSAYYVGKVLVYKLQTLIAGNNVIHSDNDRTRNADITRTVMKATGQRILWTR